MFKDFQRGFVKFFTLEKTILILVLILLVWGVSSYSYSKYGNVDTMSGGYTPNAYMVPSSTPSHMTGAMKNPTGSDQPSLHATAAQNIPTLTSGYALQPVANPSDLLPVDNNAAWGGPMNSNFMSQGNIVMPDLLQAGYHIGLDTIGQTLRNANYQERSDPIIPKQDVGPWYQSTIEPDLARVPLEVGYGCK
jgi:hypothetical protein